MKNNMKDFIMKSLQYVLTALLLLGFGLYASAQKTKQKTNEEWKKELTDEQYYILCMKGTEHPFSSPLNANKKKGVYKCAACKTVLFGSDHKFDSGTGWPSFYKPLYSGNISEKKDLKFGMVRTEILCKSCGGHLGHVFDDGPKPTGLRYCINGSALVFEEATTPSALK